MVSSGLVLARISDAAVDSVCAYLLRWSINDGFRLRTLRRPLSISVAYFVGGMFAAGGLSTGSAGIICLRRLRVSLYEDDSSLGFPDLFVMLDDVGIFGVAGTAACLCFPRENHDIEDDVAFEVFEVVDVTEDFRERPIIGILLFSLSFSK